MNLYAERGTIYSNNEFAYKIKKPESIFLREISGFLL